MDMSDLDLVAQATANERSPAGPSSPKSPLRTAQDPNGGLDDAQDADGPASRALRDLGDLELEDVDLSSLSPQDLATLQPLIEALRISDPARLPPGFGQDNLDGEDDDGGDESGDPGDIEIARILAQMDAAEHVADELDDKLDKLLANLGKVEAEMEQDTPGAVETQEKQNQLEGEREEEGETK